MEIVRPHSRLNPSSSVAVALSSPASHGAFTASESALLADLCPEPPPHPAGGGGGGGNDEHKLWAHIIRTKCLPENRGAGGACWMSSRAMRSAVQQRMETFPRQLTPWSLFLDEQNVWRGRGWGEFLTVLPGLGLLHFCALICTHTHTRAHTHAHHSLAATDGSGQRDL